MRGRGARKLPKGDLSDSHRHVWGTEHKATRKSQPDAVRLSEIDMQLIGFSIKIIGKMI